MTTNSTPKNQRPIIEINIPGWGGVNITLDTLRSLRDGADMVRDDLEPGFSPKREALTRFIDFADKAGRSTTIKD